MSESSNPPFRLLVCGSRTWDDPVPINWIVLGLAQECEAWCRRLVVISGGARGADEAAMKAAYAYDNVDHENYPADWTHDGKAAGPIRNQRMLNKGRPDAVVACADDLAASKGTADMVRRARSAGLRVYVVSRPA